jgi:hypothetical protein
VGHARYIVETRNAYKIIVGKPERKRQLGVPGRRLENNIKINII